MPARGYSSTAPSKKDGTKRKEAPARKKSYGVKKAESVSAAVAGAATKQAVDKSLRKKQHGLKVVAAANALTPAGITKTAGRTLKNIVVATADRPGAVLKNTAKGARDTAAAIPAGIVETLTTRPDKTVKKIVDDYTTRYGQSDKEQIERFQKEGITPELLDATAVLGGGAATGGRALSGTAAKGVLGPRAKAVATAPRPALRTTGGKAKPQAKSRNYFKAEIQVAVDKQRAKKTTKKSKDEPLDAVRAAARKANDAAGKIVEVVPSARKVSKSQRVRVATVKGRAVQQLKGEQIRVVEKTARRVLNQLDDAERAAFYYVASGTVSADAARAAAQLARRRQSILEQRDARGIGEQDGLRKKTDEVRTIDKLLEDPTKGFTPRVRDTVQALRAVDLHVGRQDPTLTARQRVLRRYAPQAEALGIRRGEGAAPSPERASLPTREEFIANRPRPSRDHPDPTVEDLSRNLAPQGTAGVRIEPVRMEYRDPYTREVVDLGDEIQGLKAVVARDKSGAIIGALRMTLDAAGKPDILEVAVAPAHRGKGLGTKLYAAAEKAGLDVEAASGRGGLTEAGAALKHKRMSAKQRVPVAALYDPDETTTAFIKRVREAADNEGLERPMYFPSEKYALADGADFASRAVGGARATKPSFKYTGELFRTGRQDTTPEVLLTGLARTIKRKHNHRLVADTLNEHAFEGLTNMRMGQLKEALVDMGVAPNGRTVAYWNPGLYRERLRGADADAPGDKNLDADERAALVQEGEDFGEAQSTNALAQSLVLPEQLTPEMRAGGGWSAVPRGAYDEIMNTTRPSGATARSWDIAKSKQSRILLGTLNIPWLGFQVASNTLLGAAATHGRIAPALIEQHRWYKRLSDEQRDAVDALVGDSASHSSAGRTHMGAASNAAIVNQYRALKANPIWDRQLKGKGPSLRQLNPIEAMFALDRTQNNAFRRAVLHDQMKRGAAQRMAGDIEGARALQERISTVIVGRLEQVVNAMLKDREVMEQHAKHVDDWLGNWTTFTSRERAVGNRFLMFYPYLRFSLKLAFHTLPAQHPLLLAMAGKLGQLQQEELEKLGVADLPWASGRLYFKGEDDKLQQIDLARMNPLMNAVSSMKQPSQLLGALPPVVQSLVADQLTHRSSFKDEEWRVEGKSGAYGAKGTDYGFRVRSRIALDDMLSLVYPYRAAKTQVTPGPQGDDSLLWDPRPIEYKDKKITSAVKKSVDRKKEDASVLREVVPLLGEPTDDPAVAKSRLARDKPAKPSRRRKQSYGVGGDYGSSSYGGSGGY